MRPCIRVGLLLLSFFVFTAAPTAFSQSHTTSSRPKGWQGPWPDDWQGEKPAPQSESIPPSPQSTTPSGKQVMEIPSRPQSPSDLPGQQAEIPRRPQPEELRPDQLITVTVTDPQGRYVAGLRSEDFAVYEDEEPQKVTYFNTGEKEPLSMGILVDVSGSMRPKIDRARFALRRLIEVIRPGDEVFLEAFNSRPKLLQDFTDSRMLLSQAMALLRAEGGTALYDAILEGLFHIRQGRNAKKTLVIVSDGDDVNSNSSLEEVISAARRAGILVYAVGIIDRDGGGAGFQIGPFSLGAGGSMSSGYGDRVLREIATATGGTLFLMNENDVLANEPVLDTAVQTISRELRSQYSLGYTPTRSGSHYRRVRVEARAKNTERLTVRTQEGYALDSQEREEKTKKIFQN